MSQPNYSGADVAFLLNSSQPEDLDDAVTLEQNSDCAKAAGGIQTAVFFVEREPKRDVAGGGWSQGWEFGASSTQIVGL
jgi:hypothetical protein